MIKAVFFDAVGTLLFLPESVGQNYALVGQQIGLQLDRTELDRAFLAAWKSMPTRQPIAGPRPNDDKDWWRALVDIMLKDVAPRLGELDRDNFFEVAYEHFAEAGVWELYPDVLDVLRALHDRFCLGVVSNFDGRLRLILEHLGIARFFRHIFVSSELGADKPDPEIFRRALRFTGFSPNEVVHVGDDPERDWAAAAAAGLKVFELDRSRNSLADLREQL